MLRFTFLLLIHLLITLVLAAVFFILLPLNGDYWGIALAQVWTIAVLFLGDRALLSTLKAKRLGEGAALAQRIANLRALRRFERRFEVFSSRELPNNILLIDSFFRTPAMVVGAQVLEQMREEDLNELLVLAIERLEYGRWRYATVSAQLLSLFALPMLLFSFGEKPSPLVTLLSSPCDVLTDLAWRLGGAKPTSSRSVEFALASYPKLWGEERLRTARILRPYMSRLLSLFLLIPPAKNSVLLNINDRKIKAMAEQL